MSAETLTRAADLLDEKAKRATPGPWVTYPTPRPGPDGWSDAAHTVGRPWDDYGKPECGPFCGADVLVTGAEGCDDDWVSRSDADYIATMHPGVAEDMAATLREGAENWRQLSQPGVLGDVSADPLLASLVTLARAVLGEA